MHSALVVVEKPNAKTHEGTTSWLNFGSVLSQIIQKAKGTQSLSENVWLIL
jgi:hypothetical protein